MWFQTIGATENIGPTEALKLLKSKRRVTSLDRLGGILPVWKRLHQFHGMLTANKTKV